MGGAARLVVIGALVASALTSCVVTFDDYPVSALDAGADASSGSGGSQAGAAGWAAVGGAGGVDAGGGASGSSAGAAGTSGSAGAAASGGAGTGGVDGGSVDCSQYVYGLVGSSCYAYQSKLVASVSECTTTAGAGMPFIICDLSCLNTNGNTCVANELVSSVTTSGVCVLNTPMPGCEAQCLNHVDYDEALSASCDQDGACAFSKTNCGNYRCDPSTKTCKTGCKESLDCVSLLQCLSGVCTTPP